MNTTILRDLETKGFTLVEAQVFADSRIPYWHSSLVERNGNPLAGGFGKDQHYSRKVAVAEYLERTVFSKACEGGLSESKKWGIHIIPTACGFAAGFNEANTIVRSIREATERWVMSKWIDDKYYIEEISSEEIQKSLDPVSKFFASQFDRIRYFKKEVLVDLGSTLFKVEVAQTMGIKGNGIFPGSSAQLTGGSIWQHSLLESYRHLLAIKNNPKDHHRFPANKVFFFAENAETALSQVESAYKKDWPMPKVTFHHVEPFMGESYFVARTILGGWKSWDLGPLERFLY